MRAASTETANTAAEELLRRSSTMVLGVAPEVILQTLGRLGSLRFVVSSAAALVDQVATSLSVPVDAAAIGLDTGVQLWPFPRRWRLTLAVQEPLSSPSLVSLRVFDRAGAQALEIHVSARGNGGARIRGCLARWQAHGPAALAGAVRFDAPAHKLLACAATASPGLEEALGAVRRSGSEEALRSLETRHGLTRLEAISMLRAPWARRIQRGGAHDIFQEIACRSLHTRMLLGNAAASYVRSGHMPLPRRHGGVVRLRERGFNIEVRESAVAQLWAVRLRAPGARDAGDMVSSIEAFDVAGDPAFLLFGGRDRNGLETPAWKKFVDGAGRRTPLDALGEW